MWLSFNQSEFSSLPLSFPSLSAANLLLVAGGVTMVTGFLGCLGALKEQRCLLMTVRTPLLQRMFSILNPLVEFRWFPGVGVTAHGINRVGPPSKALEL